MLFYYLFIYKKVYNTLFLDRNFVHGVHWTKKPLKNYKT